MNDCRILQSLTLTDLSIPLKKATANAIVTLLASLTSTKGKLVIERCLGSEAIIQALLKALTNVKQISLNEMGLTATHIATIPKLLETSSSRKVLVLHLR